MFFTQPALGAAVGSASSTVASDLPPVKNPRQLLTTQRITLVQSFSAFRMQNLCDKKSRVCQLSDSLTLNSAGNIRSGDRRTRTLATYLSSCKVTDLVFPPSKKTRATSTRSICPLPCARWTSRKKSHSLTKTGFRKYFRPKSFWADGDAPERQNAPPRPNRCCRMVVGGIQKARSKASPMPTSPMPQAAVRGPSKTEPEAIKQRFDSHELQWWSSKYWE